MVIGLFIAMIIFLKRIKNSFGERLQDEVKIVKKFFIIFFIAYFLRAIYLDLYGHYHEFEVFQ